MVIFNFNYILIKHCLNNGCTFYEWANFLHNSFISITCFFLITSEIFLFFSGELICVKFKFAQLFLLSRFMMSSIVLRDYFLNHFHSNDPFSSMFHLTCAFLFSRTIFFLHSNLAWLKFPEVITSLQKSCFIHWSSLLTVIEWYWVLFVTKKIQQHKGQSETMKQLFSSLDLLFKFHTITFA